MTKKQNGNGNGDNGNGENKGKALVKANPVLETALAAGSARSKALSAVAKADPNGPASLAQTQLLFGGKWEGAKGVLGQRHIDCGLGEPQPNAGHLDLARQVLVDWGKDPADEDNEKLLTRTAQSVWTMEAAFEAGLTHDAASSVITAWKKVDRNPRITERQKALHILSKISRAVPGSVYTGDMIEAATAAAFGASALTPPAPALSFGGGNEGEVALYEGRLRQAGASEGLIATLVAKKFGF